MGVRQGEAQASAKPGLTPLAGTRQTLLGQRRKSTARAVSSLRIHAGCWRALRGSQHTWGCPGHSKSQQQGLVLQGFAPSSRPPAHMQTLQPRG